MLNFHNSTTRIHLLEINSGGQRQVLKASGTNYVLVFKKIGTNMLECHRKKSQSSNSSGDKVLFNFLRPSPGWCKKRDDYSRCYG